MLFVATASEYITANEPRERAAPGLAGIPGRGYRELQARSCDRPQISADVKSGPLTAIIVEFSGRSALVLPDAREIRLAVRAGSRSGEVRFSVFQLRCARWYFVRPGAADEPRGLTASASLRCDFACKARRGGSLLCARRIRVIYFGVMMRRLLLPAGGVVGRFPPERNIACTKCRDGGSVLRNLS
jgi:hypothetical protein